MPIGPYNKTIRKDVIERIYNIIDKRIENYYMLSVFFYVVVNDFHLTFYEKKTIIDKYIKAGWSDVEYKTSKENGERPGLARFTLIR